MALQLSRRLRYWVGVVALVLGIVVVGVAFRVLVTGAVDAGLWRGCRRTEPPGRRSWRTAPSSTPTCTFLPEAAFWRGMRYARAERSPESGSFNPPER
jgi:hypothetical protein